MKCMFIRLNTMLLTPEAKKGGSGQIDQHDIYLITLILERPINKHTNYIIRTTNTLERYIESNCDPYHILSASFINPSDERFANS